MVAGGIVAHALEGEVLLHLLHLVNAHWALQEVGHIVDYLVQLGLHALVAGEVDVRLVAQLPEVEHVRPARCEIHVAIDEGVHEIILGALVANHAPPVVKV